MSSVYWGRFLTRLFLSSWSVPTVKHRVCARVERQAGDAWLVAAPPVNMITKLHTSGYYVCVRILARNTTAANRLGAAAESVNCGLWARDRGAAQGCPGENSQNSLPTLEFLQFPQHKVSRHHCVCAVLFEVVWKVVIKASLTVDDIIVIMAAGKGKQWPELPPGNCWAPHWSTLLL